MKKNSEEDEAELHTLSKFNIARSNDIFREKWAPLVKTTGNAFTFNKNGIIVRKVSIHGSTQKLVHTSSRASLLRQANYSTLVRNRGDRRMYESLTRDRYLQYMVTTFYYTMKNCSQCLRIGTTIKPQWQLELFPPAGPLELVAIDILELLPRTGAGSQLVVQIKDRYRQFTMIYRVWKSPKRRSRIFSLIIGWCHTVSQTKFCAKTVNNSKVSYLRHYVPA